MRRENHSAGAEAPNVAAGSATGPAAPSTSPPGHQTVGGSIRDLTTLRVFVRVVELQSFSVVARRLGVTPATVSKQVASLESSLKTRLVNRTTRRLFVTEAGERLYQHCLRIIEEVDRAESDVADASSGPAGSIRATVPLMIAARRVAPRLPQFMLQYPRISVDLDVSVDKLDLLKEHIDVALRVAEEVDSGFVAFKLAPYRRIFVASPAYLAAHGTPRTPDDLARHNCLVSRGATLNSTWPMNVGGRIEAVRVKGSLIVNHGEFISHAAVAGLGIAMSARWNVDDELRSGQLVQILQDFTPEHRAIYAVLPRQGVLSPKLRVFIEFLRECCKGM